MLKKELYMFPFVLIVLISLSGCATTLQSYQPKGPEELRVKELFLKWESTWNSRDVPGHLSLWNENAQIMYGSNRQIASKKEYTGILPERMRANPSISVGAPNIKISENRAEVSVSLSLGSTQTSATFYLIRENNLWSIMSWKY